MPLIFYALPAAEVDARVLAAPAARVAGDIVSATLYTSSSDYTTRLTRRRFRSHYPSGSTCCESCCAALGRASFFIFNALLTPAGLAVATGWSQASTASHRAAARCGVDFVLHVDGQQRRSRVLSTGRHVPCLIFLWGGALRWIDFIHHRVCVGLRGASRFGNGGVWYGRRRGKRLIIFCAAIGARLMLTAEESVCGGGGLCR